MGMGLVVASRWNTTIYPIPSPTLPLKGRELLMTGWKHSANRIFEAFKATGKGWQTRMNALRMYIEEHQLKRA
jgi:hypothetical protein